MTAPKALRRSPNGASRSQHRGVLPSFAELRRDFLADLSQQVAVGSKSGNTLWTYEKRLEFFERQMTVGNMAEVTPELISRFLTGLREGTLPDSRKPASSSYVAGHWRHLVGFLRWCRRRGHPIPPELFEFDELRGRNRFSVGEPVVDEADVQPQPWSPEEQEQIRSAARSTGARDQLMVELLRQTGMRLSEVASLRLEDLQGEQIRVVRSKSVRGRRLRTLRWVPVYPGLGRMLEVWTQRLRPTAKHDYVLTQDDGSEPLSARGIDSALDRIHRRAGVGPGGAQRYRDTFATEFLRKNPGQLKKLKDILGHADFRTVERYARIRRADLMRVEEDPFA